MEVGSIRGEDPLMGIVYGLAGGYFLWLWARDAWAGAGESASLPGAFWVAPMVLVWASLGALTLVMFATAGEYALGVVEQQDRIAAWFLLSMLAAAVVEEVVFRGFLVVTGRGQWWLWASVISFSAVFAMMHPYCWDFAMPDGESWAFWRGQWTWQLDAKGVFSTLVIFLNALWFYAVRFLPNNPKHSLLPCFVAHAVSNFAVFAIKAVQGFVVW